MTLTLVDSGTQTATVTTEHSLFTSTTAGEYWLTVNLENMAHGDTVRIRAYEDVLAADAARRPFLDVTFANVQGTAVASASTGAVVRKIGPVVITGADIQFSLEQQAGTSRNFKWRVDRRTDLSAADILTTQMTEAYAADGVAPTLAQAIFAILQQAGEFAISGTTITVKKLDGSTTAMTFTLDDATNPTSRTRAT